jgi:hypothetical protein
MLVDDQAETLSPAERVHQEVQEIFEVLQRWEPHRQVTDLWTEALTLHRVRYETKVLPAGLHTK